MRAFPVLLVAAVATTTGSLASLTADVEPAAAGAGMYVVDLLTDGPADGCDHPNGCTLRDAVDDANTDPGAGMITFAVQGTITLTVADDIDVTEALTIVGPTPDPADLVVDADGNSRIFDATADLSVENLTLTGGDAGPTEGGGAIRAYNGDMVDDDWTVTVTNTVLHGNTTGVPGNEGGGAIQGEAAVVIESGSRLTGNTATGTGTPRGGAVVADDIDVTDSVIGGPDPGDANTTTGSGGGLASTSGVLGTIDVTDSIVEGNTATGSIGGGILGVQTAITITRSTVADNHATASSGGGVNANAAVGTSVTVVDSTFTGNTALSNGGAIESDGPVTVTNSTMVNNDGGGFGGAISADDEITLTHATIVENTGTSVGFGANVSVFGDLTAFGSVVGLPQTGPNCFVGGTPTSLGYNFSDTDTCGFTDPTDTTFGGDPLLSPLADNGGPSATRLPAAASPLVGAIPTSDCDPAVLADQRGVERPVEPGCDIGAVEADERPDALARKGKEPFVGDDVYNTTGRNQRVQRKKARRETAKFRVRVESDATHAVDDLYTVTGGGSNRKFKVRYFDGVTEVTDDVTGAGYELTDVDPGDATTLKVRVKIKAGAKPGNKRKTLVSAASAARPPHTDTVKLVTKVR